MNLILVTLIFTSNIAVLYFSNFVFMSSSFFFSFLFLLPHLFVFSLETLGEARREQDGCSSLEEKENERKKGNKKTERKQK